MYEEFLKEVNECGNARNRTYIRTECKNCSAIIEYDKSKRKTHKGYCCKCSHISRKGFVLTKDDTIYEYKGRRSRGVKITCEKCGKEHITSVSAAKRNKYRLCKACVQHEKKPRFRSIEDIQKYIRANVTISENGCWLWNKGICSDGYGKASLNGETWRANRLSYSVFVSPITTGKIICHRCDNPLCVSPKCLFQARPYDNSRDMVKKNRQAKGEQCGPSKLTEKDVRDIKKALNDGEDAQELAKKYGVTFHAIYRIKNGKTWRHVK